MQLNKFIGSTGYEIIKVLNDDDWELLRTLKCTYPTVDWRPIRIRRVRGSKREGFRPADSPWACISSRLFFRRSAVDALRDLLEKDGELLPVEDEEGIELYVYNPRQIDAIDQNLSDGPRDKHGKLEGYGLHVFIPSLVEGVDVFRLTSNEYGDIYLSDRFVKRWKKAKLKGLDFKLVWDSELPPDKQPRV